MILEGIEKALTIAYKDLLQFSRMRVAVVSFILLPIILMAMFGYMFPSTFGTKPSITHIPLGVVNQDQSSMSVLVVNKFKHMATSSGMFDIKEYATMNQARNELIKGSIRGILIFGQGFGDQLTSGRPAYVQLIVDQTSSTLAQVISGEVKMIISNISHEFSVTFLSRNGDRVNPSYIINPISVITEKAVPGAPSTFEFMAPGFMALTVVTAGMSGVAASIARERERGTFDAILVSPIPAMSIIIGKSLAQTVRGMIQAFIVLGLSILLFGVKVYGSFLLMCFVLLLTVLSTVGLGIIATSAISEQETAMMMLMLLQFPMLFLCDILFPIEQMPGWMQQIAWFLPLTYAGHALRKVMVFGANLSQVSYEVTILLLWSVVTLSLAIPLFKRAITR